MYDLFVDVGGNYDAQLLHLLEFVKTFAVLAHLVTVLDYYGK